MQEITPNQEIITLVSPGPLPGIPGASHGPGTFLVDYDARTATEIKPEGDASAQEMDTSGTEQGQTPPSEGAIPGQSEGN